MKSQHRWLERGQGEPVVLLHGLMGQMHHWDDVLDELGGACRAMAPTLPIFDPGCVEPSIDVLARWVVDFLDALEIPRAVIGGNSLGGHVALATALAFPERVRAVILTGSSGLFERSFTRGVPHRPTADYLREKMEEVFFDRTLVTPEWVESVRCTLIEPPSVSRVARPWGRGCRGGRENWRRSARPARRSSPARTRSPGATAHGGAEGGAAGPGAPR